MVFIIKIDIDNTKLYEVNDDNKIISKYDNTGNFTIPTSLYFYKDNEQILCGNETRDYIFENGYISNFLENLNKSYEINILHNNQLITLNRSHLLFYFIKYLLKLLNESDNDVHNKNIYIIIPYIYDKISQEILFEIYQKIFEHDDFLNYKIIIETEKVEYNKNDVLISINYFNTIVKNSFIYKQYDYGILSFQNELLTVIIDKLQFKNINVRYKNKIKRYIKTNFQNILNTLNNNKDFNCILELDEIYNIKLSKRFLLSFYKVQNNIENIVNEYIDTDYNIITYNDNLRMIFKNKYNYENYNENYTYLYDNKPINTSTDFLNDKIPISLGIKLESGLMCRFINKNTTIPYKKSKLFVYKFEEKNECGNSIEFEIYKGNNLYAIKNELLKKTMIEFKDTYKTTELKIKITFFVKNFESLLITIENVLTNEKFDIDIILNLINFNYISDSDEEFQSIEEV